MFLSFSVKTNIHAIYIANSWLLVSASPHIHLFHNVDFTKTHNATVIWRSNPNCKPFHLRDAVQSQTLPMLLCKQGPGVFHYSIKYYYAILMQHKGMQVYMWHCPLITIGLSHSQTAAVEKMWHQDLVGLGLEVKNTYGNLRHKTKPLSLYHFATFCRWN